MIELLVFGFIRVFNVRSKYFKIGAVVKIYLSILKVYW